MSDYDINALNMTTPAAHEGSGAAPYVIQAKDENYW